MLLLTIFSLMAAITGGSFQGRPDQIRLPQEPASQAPATQKDSASQTAASQTTVTSAKGQTAQQKATPQKRPTWRVVVQGAPNAAAVSIRAKKAPIADVVAELARQLKIPIILAPKIKEEPLTTDFENFPLESAVRLIAPNVIIDYMLSGGEGPVLSKKEIVAIYLMSTGESPSREGPFILNKSGAQLVVGTVFATEDEEKAALELKKVELQVTEENGLFTIKAHKQLLTDVLQEVADKAHIPFSLVTTNGAQKEIDQIVTWDIKAVTLEELTRAWLPNAIRLYLRTSLQSYVSTPLRLTIEPPNAAEVERIVTP